MLRRIAGAVGWAASNRDERNDGQLRSQSGGPGVGGGMLDTVPEVDEETESTEWQAEVGADLAVQPSQAHRGTTDREQGGATLRASGERMRTVVTTVPRHAVKHAVSLPLQQLPPRPTWPADRLAAGLLELRGKPRRNRLSKRALCTILGGVMSFHSHPQRSGAEEGRLLATVDVSALVVTVSEHELRQFVICSSLDPDVRQATLVHCCASSQEARNKWLAVLHRMGVDLYAEMDGGHFMLLRRGAQQAV